MRLQPLTILILTLAGFALRLLYLITSHPFFDEYTTVLAARQILRRGWPVLPSGLFYEHGLLATYLIAPFTALFIDLPLGQWQPAHWGLMLSRWPSLLIGTATVPLIFVLGRRYIRSGPALLAAGLFALSPEGMVWGGRARMYALATLLVLVIVSWAYRGATYPAPARYRWWALLALLATLLTQFGALILVPPLVIAMLVIGWLSWRRANRQARDNAFRAAHRPWFLQPAIFLEGLALGAVVGLAIWIKRLGQPLGVAALSSSLEQNKLLAELFTSTIAYQTALHFTWPDTVTFLARQFGVPHHFWLTLLTLAGALLGLFWWTVVRPRYSATYATFNLFLWLIFGLIILEMVTLLEPFRRNPRYLVMYLPLFYLIAANAIFNFRHLPKLISRSTQYAVKPNLSAGRRPIPSVTASLPALALLFLLTALGFNDLRVALLTPEPAYDQAFAWLAANRQPGDHLLTMNTPAAGLYLGRADGFTVQNQADQFLLNAGRDPVDRWLGVPWVGSAPAFNAALNATDRAWFVIDTIRLPVYFQGNWLAIVNSQLEPAWAGDNVLVYRTRPDREPIPTGPDTLVNVTLGDSIQLLGYTRQDTGSSPHQPPISLRLTLFWQPQTAITTDYTLFLHLRNQEGVTVAQWDGQPLNDTYPTSQWQSGETVIDPIKLTLPEDLPAGRYDLFTGLYRLDTLERLPVANDTSGENAIFLGEVTLP